MKRIATLGLLSLSLLPAVFPVAAYATPQNDAFQVAQAYWGPSRCQGSIPIEWDTQTPTPSLPGTEVEAWVTFQTTTGELDWSAAVYTGCVIHLSLNAWPTEADRQEAYPELCQVMVHEYGHFEGWADSTSYAPTDIRYPLQSASNMPTACEAPLLRLKPFETRRGRRRKSRRP
jgi:hypothetical protein